MGLGIRVCRAALLAPVPQVALLFLFVPFSGTNLCRQGANSSWPMAWLQVSRTQYTCTPRFTL